MVMNDHLWDTLFLIAVDAHSKWPEVVCMNSTNSLHRVEVLRLLFSWTEVSE